METTATTTTTTPSELGKPLILLICGTLVYYHCAYRNSSLLSLVSDVFIVLLCSLAILGMLFRQMNISVPVDPLEWQISQDTANDVIAWLANTVGAAESVLRVAATGHDKRLFIKYFKALVPPKACEDCFEVCESSYRIELDDFSLHPVEELKSSFEL
ncbi:hypothetical protein GIB67_027976 [Kingdonia uniflora]|uniref:Reticulon domain-containing protein n=1 Tax=Kingdonia uniflora TaxID=39325 RepID=A0A7J7LGW8_9MAGN|nr:hypothetical protein GIB67_027976 [Kingdonia uniflora]